MNNYQKDICLDASEALLKSAKLLKDAESDLFNIEGGESLHTFYRATQALIEELQQEYYAKSQEDDAPPENDQHEN